jgi:hypothetical protein
MNYIIMFVAAIVVFALGYGVGWRVGSEQVFNHIRVMFEEIDNDVLADYIEEMHAEGTD